jgi:hypothetical protein
MICNKKEQTNINYYLIGIVLFSFVASFLNIYPLGIGRTALYMLPIVIMIIIRPLDTLSYKSIIFYLLLFLFIASTYKYYTIDYICKINNVVTTFRNFQPKSLMLELKNKYNANTDVVVTTEASVYSYAFYAIKLGFNPEWILSSDNVSAENSDKKGFYDYYNNLDKNRNYWFYLIKEFDTYPHRQYTIDWLKEQNVIYYKKDRDSYLYYIKPPYKRVNL